MSIRQRSIPDKARNKKATIISGTSDLVMPVRFVWNINSEAFIQEKNGNGQRMVSAHRRALKIMNVKAIANPTTILACLLHSSRLPKK